jgi:hypothetical protein
MTDRAKTECESLLAAAQAALNKGWHVFAAPHKTKSAYKGTHGSKDAVNDDRALSRWKNGTPSNPCIRLDKSDLVVLDVDHGLTSLEHAEAWAAANDIPETYVVSSGRQGGGFHFYFRGNRILPDCTRNPGAGRVGFELGDVSGDLKHHGHVVAEGGLHKSGATYRGNGKQVAPLPDWIRDYEDPAAKKKRERQETVVKKRAEGPVEQAESGVLIESGKRHDFLLREAGRLRYQGLEEQALYLALRDICRRFCEDGENYSDAGIRSLAKYIGAKSCDRRLRRPKVVVARIQPPTQQGLIAQSLRREFPIGCLVTIQTIMGRVATEYPNASKTTVQRAMLLANFVTSGKDPTDRRKALWTRCGPPSNDKTPHKTPLTALQSMGWVESQAGYVSETDRDVLDSLTQTNSGAWPTSTGERGRSAR